MLIAVEAIAVPAERILFFERRPCETSNSEPAASGGRCHNESSVSEMAAVDWRTHRLSTAAALALSAFCAAGDVGATIRRRQAAMRLNSQDVI
jgi:hypothetical protein